MKHICSKGKSRSVGRVTKAPERSLKGTGALKVSDQGELEEIEVRPEAFDKSLPSLPPYLHFSFDAAVGSRVAVEGTFFEADEIYAGMNLGTPDLVPGVSGAALRLSGGDSFLETDWPGISGNRARTVACWVRIDADQYGRNNVIPGLVGWGDASEGNSKWKVTAGSARGGKGLTGRASFGTDWYDSSAILEDNAWQHLVFVYRGKSLADGLPDVSIYLNGSESALIYRGGDDLKTTAGSWIDTELDSAGSKPLQIGKSPGERNTFKGDIDELYIFTGALTEEAVQELYEAKRPQ